MRFLVPIRVTFETKNAASGTTSHARLFLFGVLVLHTSEEVSFQ